MITPSFSPTATERVLPKLALDFTTASLDNRVTFTRTTSASNPATYTNSNGVIAYATNDQPRFDYDPIALTCKGLLIEESRTNACLYSSDYTQSAWTPTAVTIETSATTAPDGTSTAQKVKEDNTNNIHRITQTSSALPCAKSFYAKAGERTNIYALIGPNANFQFFVNLSTGVVSSKGASVTSVTTKNVGNGWWRIEATAATNSANIYIYSTDDAGNTTYTGTTGYGFYLWGVQIENSAAFCTSYIPTTTTALTRNADVATMTGTNFSDWFNASEGTFVFSFDTDGIANRYYYHASASSELNSMWGYTGGTFIRPMYANVSGSNTVSLISGTVAANTVFKCSAAYKLNSFAAATNGVSPVTDTSSAVPVIDRLIIGGKVTNTNQLNGHMRQFFYYPQLLINAEVQAFSKQ